MRKTTQRGPVLPAVVMVLLATVATGLLVVFGFQAVGDNVLPATFRNATRHDTRHVDVTQPPVSRPGTPSAGPADPAPSTAQRASDRSRTERPTPVAVPSRKLPEPTGEPSTPPPTTPPPSSSPSPTTIAPSPTPTCGPGRKPRCPKVPVASYRPAAFTTGGSGLPASDLTPTGTVTIRYAASAGHHTGHRGHRRAHAGARALLWR